MLLPADPLGHSQRDHGIDRLPQAGFAAVDVEGGESRPAGEGERRIGRRDLTVGEGDRPDSGALDWRCRKAGGCHIASRRTRVLADPEEPRHSKHEEGHGSDWPPAPGASWESVVAHRWQAHRLGIEDGPESRGLLRERAPQPYVEWLLRLGHLRAGIRALLVDA